MALLLMWAFWTAGDPPQVRPDEPMDRPPSCTRQDQAPGPVVELEEVLVRGRRGAARLAPEIELDAATIDSLGAYDVGEALERIRQTLGLQGAPVILVNGRQVVSAANFMGFPPDALMRVEVLPQEAAAVYGEASGRPVLNIVLQQEFQSRDGLVRGSLPTAGGTSSLALDARQAEIHGDDTRQFGVQAARDTALYADERPLWLKDRPGSEGSTLSPASEAVGANLSLTARLGDWSAAFNTQAQRQVSRFSAVVDDLRIETRQVQDSVIANGGLTGEAAGWSVRLALDGGLTTLGQDGGGRVRSRGSFIGSDMGADRTVAELPAGPMRLAVSGRARYAWADGEGEGEESGRSNRLLEGRATLNAPLFRAERPGTPWRGGALSLSIGGVLSRQGGEDGGGGVNVSLSWAPLRIFRLHGQWAGSTDGPPAEAVIASPFQGPPRLVFDVARGESVMVTPLLGGNPDLGPQRADRRTVSASLGPLTSWAVHAQASWSRARITDPFGVTPELTPAVEAAFPDRFFRGTDGRLTGIDLRLLNLAAITSESLSAGVNFTIPPGAGGTALFQVGLNYTRQLRSETALRPGLPAIDQLAGDGGGMSRQQVSALLNGRVGPWSMNLTARWREGARTRKMVGVDGPDDLRREAFTVVDLKLGRLFAPPTAEGDGERRDPGLRLELGIDNLFDARPRATLGDGRPAPGYGRDDIDPVGRMVRVSLSRRF